MKRRQAKSWEGRSPGQLSKRWGGVPVYVYGKLDSTNEVARELHEAGALSGSVVLCREQTAGRGREGRPWVSPPRAGLYLSMLFHAGDGPVPALASVVAGADVASALRAAFPGLDASIKWPNDLMARDRKLGGILAETSETGREGAEEIRPLVVGVGVNVHRARLPDELPGAVALDECVDRVELVEVADAVVAGLQRRLPGAPMALEEEDLEEIDRLDWLKNRRVRHTPGGEAEPLVGVAAGIAPDGALLLRPDRGALRRVVAGSIEVSGD